MTRFLKLLYNIIQPVITIVIEVIWFVKSQKGTKSA